MVNIDRLYDLIAENEALLEKTASRRDIAFWKQVISNLSVQLRFMEGCLDPKWVSDSAVVNLRDEAMGRTLSCLANHLYPDRKIIVWAASSHIIRRMSEIMGRGRISGQLYKKYENAKRTGDWVLEEFGDKAYSIAFTAYEGEAGCWMWPESIPVPKADEGTLDHLLFRTGRELMFVDFRDLMSQKDHWLHEEIVSRPIGYGPLSTSWTKHFDALIFTRKMTPNTRCSGGSG